MNMMPPSPRRTAALAVAFEGGLVLLAIGVSWLTGRWPLPGVPRDGGYWTNQGMALAWGVLAAFPMIVGMLCSDRYPLGPLRGLQQTVDELLVPWMRGWSIPEIAVVSVVAGFGEEMLFRGLLQTELADALPAPWGVAAGLALASALFGVCHWISTGYAAAVAVAGLYLGGLLLLTENLLAPIAAHAVYDMAALIYLSRCRCGTVAKGAEPDAGSDR